MTVRQFNGTTDFITLKPGGALAAMRGGPLTMVACWRSSNVAAAQGLFRVNSSTGAVVFQMNPFSNGFVFYSTDQGSIQGQAYGPNDTWWVSAYSVSPTQVIRSHQLNLATGVWTHVAEGSANASALTPDNIWIGQFNTSERLNGDIAGVAIYGYEMSDAQAEQNLASGLARWLGAGPVGFFDLTGPVADGVSDGVFGGTYQSAISGTTAVAGQDPPNFNLSTAKSAVNDDITTKLRAEYTSTDSGTALIQRYRAGDISLRMDGRGVSYVLCPSTAALNITGRLWLAAEAIKDDWTYGTASMGETLIGKYEVLFNLKQYLLQLAGDGQVRVIFSNDGSTDHAFDSTASVAFGNGARGAIGADIQPDNGAAGKTVTFYTAPTLAGPWVQLGAPVTVATAVSIFSSNQGVSLGGHGVLGITNNFRGNLIAAEIRQGNATPGAGTLVASPRFDQVANLSNIPSSTVPGGVFYDLQGNPWGFAQGVATNWQTSSDDVYSANRPSFNSFSDVDLRVKVALADWTPASTHWVISHGNHTETVPDLRWVFSIHPNNQIRCFFSTDGTLTGIGPESVGLTCVDGSTHFLRCTFDADDGAGNSVTTYYESFDNGQSWVTIGSPHVDPAGPITLFNVPMGGPPGTGSMMLGRLNAGTQTLKYFEVRNGINGPIVAGLDLEQVPSPTHYAVGMAGETWKHDNGPSAVVQSSDRLSWDQLVAHYAAASAEGFVDDQKAFWTAFVP